MNRKEIKILTIQQQNDASCITNKNGKCRKAKRHSNKIMRQFLKKEVYNAQRHTD